VIHAFAVPSLWFKIDAVPGRINERTLTVNEPGIYYGQCSELCGARHGYMPIALEAVPRPQFEAWVRSKGGTLPGDAAALRRRPLPRGRSGGGTGALGRGCSGAGRSSGQAGRSLIFTRPVPDPKVTQTMATTADHFQAHAAEHHHDADHKPASSPAGSCRRTTRTSARST
jgi:hypothetical protein